jgi:AAA+ superfamily predicted ATPase
MTSLKISEGRCQFCHRNGSDVLPLVAGDSGFICEECAQACVSLLQPAAAENEQKTAPPEKYLYQRLARHFSPVRPQELIATSRTFPLRQQADLQNALDDLFGARRIPENFLGVHQQYRHEGLTFSKLLDQGHYPVEAAPAQYEDVNIGGGETIPCLKNGVWLLHDRGVAYVVILAQQDDYGRGSNIIVEVAAPPGEIALELCTEVFHSLEQRLSRESCYRGRIISLEQQYQYSGRASRITVHELENVTRTDVILPESTLNTVERNVLKFAAQRQSLRDLGMSTQKGLLFHGPPGTGKTHCIKYLAGALPAHTTLLITAEEMGLLPEYMALARLLQPSLVVIEDADLIARERSERDSACDEVMLNRLLNEMDGLRERADVFFILTTNRPETLEPALANRPGRIDQTIEFPLPDEALRRRLIALYSKNLTVSQQLADELARRTDGASPAFIKELLRRVAQHHLEANSSGEVSRENAEAALHEMLFSGGTLNSRLLGGTAIGSSNSTGR